MSTGRPEARALADEAATLALGAALADALGAPGTSPDRGLELALEGELGAGKTTLVRGLLRRLGVTGAVRSPTYTLIEPYEAAGWSVLHYDLYRIGDPAELELLGVRDHFAPGVLRCVEWPQRAGEDWPSADLAVHLCHRAASREVRLIPGSDAGEAWLWRLGGETTS